MTSEDEKLIEELSRIFDELVLPERNNGERELQEAACLSLDAVTKWMIARETAKVLAAIEKPLNQRTN